LIKKMSRVIVKGLPKNCTEQKVRQHFKKFNPITDVSLKFTNEGVFRKFAFVGFSDEGAAQKAIDYFNQTYFGTSKMTIETCLPISEKDKVRPWSKHTKGSSAYKRVHGDDLNIEEEPKLKKRSKNPVMNSKYSADPQFNEFLKVRGVETSNEKEEVDEDGKSSAQVLLDALDEFGGEKELSLIFRGLPANLKQTNLKEWLSPIRLKAAVLFRSQDETFAFVTFNRAADMKKALLRTDQFLGGYKVRICKFPNTAAPKSDDKNDVNEAFDPEAEKKKLEAEIMDTGRLFLRNLPYICTERDLTEHFKGFGEIVDCQCVVDRKTGNCKGFAVVTFMFPEHALAAYKDLDGTIFKGRMLHILPGKEKPAESSDKQGDAGLSMFQKKLDSDRKSEAHKAAYTWNTLFVGTNAVAEILADKLQVEKSEFLTGDEANSAGVRMSLAETRLVNETRAFLERNGVVLDSFSRPDIQRSDTVIIAKNLPAGLDEKELKEKFEQYGEIKRFLLPPECRVTALVEMKNRVDAKKAFTGLAYSRLRSQPLYLEWAPVDVFDENHKVEKIEEEVEVPVTEVKEEERITKILVRNIPFQVSEKEVRALFTAFGELKTVRLPKKAGGQAGHRGFGFIDFLSVTDARTAYNALVHSTHLYGRRLVLEWSKDTQDIEETREKTKKKLSKMERKSTSKKQLIEAIESQKPDGDSEDEDDG